MNLFVSILSLFASLLLATGVSAFSVSPIGFTSTIEPGGTQSFNITVTNNEPGFHNYQVAINSIHSTDEGQRYYEQGSDPAEGWGKAEPEKFNLSPGQSKAVKITFNVPAGTSPGAHQLAFLIASENLSGGEIGLSARSAIPLNLVISGEVIERLQFRNFSFQNRITGKNSWQYNVELYNDGTMDLQSSGLIQVKNMFGKEVASEQVLLGNAIYPSSLRRVSREISAPAVWPGKYTAKLVVQFGKSKSIIANETSIWYFPVWFAGLILVSFITFIIWLWSRNGLKK